MFRNLRLFNDRSFVLALSLGPERLSGLFSRVILDRSIVMTLGRDINQSGCQLIHVDVVIRSIAHVAEGALRLGVLGDC